ncbi:hypothetical protein SAMN05421753_108227 [Planctomicrobium piriforme]|uniref:Uncharacterized protein n=1 Tax=Planctomicrobium piriforme TaxID=1576369 RepID=A0A1I3HXD3_9PLAN|nr:hypothetical protein SAMN05421753_108227 [Planctomicrobium piriforme]
MGRGRNACFWSLGNQPRTSLSLQTEQVERGCPARVILKNRGSTAAAGSPKSLGRWTQTFVVTVELHTRYDRAKADADEAYELNPREKSRRFKMKLSTLCAALLIAASVNVAGAGLFKHKHSDCCAPEATCCAPAPSCAAPCGPSCGAPCAPACAAPCAPACAAPCAPACAAPCAPACAAPCAPACAAPCAPACCAPTTCCPSDCCAPVSCCGKKHKLAGWFKGMKKHGCNKCDDCCAPAAECCAPSCGAPCAPTCGAPCAPECAAPCGACK